MRNIPADCSVKTSSIKNRVEVAKSEVNVFVQICVFDALPKIPVFEILEVSLDFFLNVDRLLKSDLNGGSEDEV